MSCPHQIYANWLTTFTAILVENLIQPITTFVLHYSPNLAKKSCIYVNSYAIQIKRIPPSFWTLFYIT